MSAVEGRGLADLKTTAEDLDVFERIVWKYRYVHQLAFYQALVAETSGQILPVHLVAVEKRKFGTAASKLLGAFKIPPTITIKLDAIGSDVWRLLDGRTVGEILQELQRRYPDEDDLPARLGQYLSTMVSNELIAL